MNSIEPFNRLVKLAARAFYDDVSMKGDNQPKTSRGDNRGMAVVVLDALTRRPWVREEDLAKALKLHSKQLRRILRFFEEEKLVTRDHRKESAKNAKAHNAAAANDGQTVAKEGEEKVKMHTHSYCCLDYAQICDVVRYRIHRMKKKLKDELDSRNTIQHYICPSCNKRYSAFDALQLVSYTDEYFHCETCNGELVAEDDKLASEEMGDGDDNVRKRRREKLKDMQQRIEEQLKPLVAQLDRVKNLPAPEFGSLQTWERAHIGAFAIGDPAAADSSRNSQGQYGTPMPYLGQTKVEVDILSDGEKEGAESGKDGSELKVIPPWMIKDGMNLTKEQRGEKIESQKLEKSEAKDDKKQDLKDDQSVQEEYIKAYYEALRKKQEEEEAKNRMQQEGKISVPDSQTERQVGKKYKRDDDDDEDIEWEEHQPTAAGNATETYKLADLNAEAQESGDDEDDNVWEEG
ncbi:Transcription factor TFIIE alpha subunit [Zea mays]|uniref:RNA polymerase II transcription factor/ transcription initiation factor n=3 Tax=Zea mays TaxID=4577 RepID=B4FWI2_MAIZE|nr:Transcription factor TFIIE alpha subunit [Zea mays]ACF86475.1 unknown [Zea mays]ACG34563.1 RNA polymerase II transcription factor/ transcription initiation factor [Zea mays]ACN28007.1 unknown [Zea mays]AQK65623.1 Transcription factor TFIIE alpha subunit [Zea mays]AQK65630.1 Transcription factor TFIIE alpha subunit [Zea mays]|eukprot:NP_001141491.1 Transcription factor TFIIE alpha subunit [Zea mays]